jgi:hypothetical protein
MVIPTLKQGREHGRIATSSKLGLFSNIRSFVRGKPAAVINSGFSLFMVGITLKASMNKVGQTARRVSRTACHWSESKDGLERSEIFVKATVR